MSDLTQIFQEIRNLTVNNASLQALVGTRVVPQRVDLLADSNVYPMVCYSTFGGFPDRNNYPADVYVLDVYFISDKSVDQAIEIYGVFNNILNKQIIRDLTNDKYFHIAEDSKPVDYSGVFGRNMLYIYSNTYRIRTVG